MLTVLLKLTDLSPRFIKRVAPLAYEPTDDVALADGLWLCCPACHWAGQRTHSNCSHAIQLWRDPRWRFAGQGYRDLSCIAGRTLVDFMAGACHVGFQVKRGRVDFS